ncbi:eRF1 domain 1-domain-containing protein [Lipomyces oligophaga]|uniref:eRF1 domain 1-domain-containing protein n=1 Tax=Lipomyces oligophaga TaxID=45792 RepID=UPI0034CE56AF
MKILAKNVSKDGSGSIKLLPEEPNDLWHTYNLIQTGDVLRAPTFRRVTKEPNDRIGGSGGATTNAPSQRISLTLTIKVEKTDFDAPGAALHASGPVCEESPHVRLGQYHTLDLALHRAFTLTKTSYAPWDSISLQTVQAACDPGSRAEIGAVVLQPGLATVCLVGEYMTLVRQRIELAIPSKRAAGSAVAHDKALARFYSNVAKGMAQSFDYSNLKAIILASPGFANEQLLKSIFDTASKEAGLGGEIGNRAKQVLKSRSKFVLVHCASGHVHALNEVLRAPEVRAQLAETKYARETAVLDEFFRALSVAVEDGGGKAWYGARQVELAVDRGAVRTLLISDNLFRNDDVAKRKRFVALVETVKAMGGEALVFSSLHESGKQLNQFTGIAAILNFPMPELEDIEDDEEE